jgi:hypothetical protein
MDIGLLDIAQIEFEKAVEYYNFEALNRIKNKLL